MDPINKFLVDNFNSARGAVKVASAAGIQIAELTPIEKRAYAMAMKSSSMDESFLGQFADTPLYPQAIALAEQELAMEQRQLQARMAEAAQNQMRNFGQECNEREGIELQKKQLLIEMHKMKVMGQGAPTPPGQAVIGTPDPALQQAQASMEMGGGAAGGAPVQEPMGGDPTKMAAAADWMAGADTSALDPEVHKQMAHRMGLLNGATSSIAGAVTSGAGALSDGMNPRAALLSALIGGGVGGVAGYGGTRAGIGLRHMTDSLREDTKGRGTQDGKLVPEDNRLMHHLNKMVVGKGVYTEPDQKTASIRKFAQQMRAKGA